MTISVREQLIHTLDRLTDEQVEALLGVARVMQPENGSEVDDYDPDLDVAIGLYSGSPDLSERVEDILREDAEKRGGWTLKDRE